MHRVADATPAAPRLPPRMPCVLLARDSLRRSTDNGNLDQPALGAILFKWLTFGEGDTRGSIAYWPSFKCCRHSVIYLHRMQQKPQGFDIEKEGFCALH